MPGMLKSDMSDLTKSVLGLVFAVAIIVFSCTLIIWGILRSDDALSATDPNLKAHQNALLWAKLLNLDVQGVVCKENKGYWKLPCDVSILSKNNEIQVYSIECMTGSSENVCLLGERL